jgi:hypothetical protein
MPLRPWRLSLNVDITDPRYDEMGPAASMKEVVARLREKEATVAAHFGPEVLEQFNTIISSLHDTAQMEDVEEFDSYLSELYDWADFHRVWIGGPGSHSSHVQTETLINNLTE